MNKEKLVSLLKYQQEINNRLSDQKIPQKHSHRPESYKAFLKNELRIVSLKIEQLKTI